MGVGDQIAARVAIHEEPPHDVPVTDSGCGYPCLVGIEPVGYITPGILREGYSGGGLEGV